MYLKKTRLQAVKNGLMLNWRDLRRINKARQNAKLLWI